MAAVSLTTLRARARSRADMIGSSFVADDATGVDAWLNEGAQKLHDKCILAYGEDYVESTYSTTTTTATDYALPADFYKLFGVDATFSSRPVTLRPYNRPERNFRNDPTFAFNNVPRYRLAGGNLRLSPAPNSGIPLTIYYAPVLQVLQGGTGSTYINLLTSAADTINFPNGWEKYVVLYAAIQMMLKEESDVRILLAELQKLDEELEEIINNRNAADPHTTVDIDAQNAFFPWDYSP